jgi:hypothetical protein
MKVKRWTNKGTSCARDDFDHSGDNDRDTVELSDPGTIDESSSLSSQENHLQREHEVFSETQADVDNDHGDEALAKAHHTTNGNVANDDGAGTDMDLDSLEEPSCAICFAPLEVGDRIGDLRCKHEFHVDCLKTWMQRKNACPLCNVPIGKRIRREGAVSGVGGNALNEHHRDDNARRRRRRGLGLPRSVLENRQIGIMGGRTTNTRSDESEPGRESNGERSTHDS